MDAPAALLTSVAAQVDPYRFAHQLLAHFHSSGGLVHARTAMQSFETVRGGVRIRTEDGPTIHCKHLVLAAGYENQPWLDQKVASNRSSYAFVSEPMGNELGALSRTLVWESARPYLYMRTTADRRLLVGGEDDDINIPLRRDARVKGKAATLSRRVEKLLPHLDVKVAFAWAGTFAETEDGLPFFGIHEQYGPRVHFAMAYGGNGITYSLIGAELLRDSLQGRRHPCAALFSFDRLART
jgi:glycine/D-amino acid oxidase-like deaminating enzyme